MIFHPVSNVFVPVWRGCHRVLRPGGRLLAGMMNPCFFLFDHDDVERGGALMATYPLPYAEPGLDLYARRVVPAGRPASAASSVKENRQTESLPPLRRGSALAEQIPITWVAPADTVPASKLVIWLAPGLMEMRAVEPVLERLAHAGYLAVSFDSWGVVRAAANRPRR